MFMPSLVEAAAGLGVKFVSVFPNNKKLGKKTIYGVMVLSDVENIGTACPVGGVLFNCTSNGCCYRSRNQTPGALRRKSARGDRHWSAIQRDHFRYP
ncbi:hypothetical protein [Brevibacillus massiliensis]|uniref:hypothetical protein n=1 Tax=Brevibacillus massiliensis TaxID=1118054 RepID=UPI003CCB5A6E